MSVLFNSTIWPLPISDGIPLKSTPNLIIFDNQFMIKIIRSLTPISSRISITLSIPLQTH